MMDSYLQEIRRRLYCAGWMWRLERFWGGPMFTAHGKPTGQRKFGWRLFAGPIVLHFEAWENPSRYMRREKPRSRERDRGVQG